MGKINKATPVFGDDGQKLATPVYNYSAGRYEFVNSKGTGEGFTVYRTIDDRTFTSLDADPERHAPLTDELSAELLEALAEIAIADPTEAIDLFKLLPEHHKPQLRARLKSLPPEAHKALKQAAQEAAIAPQPSEEPQPAACNASQQAQDDQEGESGLSARAGVVNLNREPQWLRPGVDELFYIGRANKRLDLSASLLANVNRMKGDSLPERDRVCDMHINDLIACLKVAKGPTYKALIRLAKRVRDGEAVKLGCFCAPKRCHGDAIALVVNAIADKVPRAEIIERLEKLLPVEQPVLLEV